VYGVYFYISNVAYPRIYSQRQGKKFLDMVALFHFIVDCCFPSFNHYRKSNSDV